MLFHFLAFSAILQQETDVSNDIEDETLQLLLLGNSKLDKAHKKRLHQKAFYHGLSMKERRRRRMCMPVASLLAPADAPFNKVLKSKSDQGLIALTGFDFKTFEHLKMLFQPLFLGLSPHSEDGKIHKLKQTRGKKRKVDAANCLGLYLTWCRTTGSNKVLQLIFGLSSQAVSIYLRFARRILITVLSEHEDAKFKMPSDQKILEFKAVVEDRFPLLDDAAFSMDGLKVKLENAGNPFVQNRYYNGWKSETWVVNVLCFTPDGKIVLAGLNMPGSYHDSKVAHQLGVYETLRTLHTRIGVKTVVDSAFDTSDRNRDLFYKSGVLPSLRDGPQAIARNAQATSFRQCSEWGMQAVQGLFPRVADVLKFEEKGERGRILLSIFLLYNLRCSRVGQNQLDSVYDGWRDDFIARGGHV